MSQIREEKQIKYFISYAGSCLKIWNSIIGQQITHYLAGPGTIVDIEKNSDSIVVKVQFHTEQEPKPFLGTERNLLRVFTHLTLPGEVVRELETRYWNINKEDLLNQLNNLASQSSIDQSTFDTFEAVYNQLMRMHQTRKFPEQTIQKINGYQQKLMNGRQKLIDREMFSNLSAKAMNPIVETCFPLPKLDEDDIQLIGKWCQPPRNNLDRTSIIKARSKEKWELGRLLSARSAEKVSIDFYRHYGKKVKDISITQIYENSKCDWRNYDLDVDGLHIDVKNSRQSQNSSDRYTEYYIQKKFKHSKGNQEVTISGVFSPYLWPCTLLEPTEYHGDTTTQFLGETTRKNRQTLKNEFNDLVDFVEPNPGNEYFLPPWVFEYPDYIYTERNKALKELENFTNLDALKGATFKFELRPVGVAAGIDLTEILGNEVLDGWERSFLNQLRNRIEKYGLSLPFLFLTILEHFLSMATSSKTVSDFEPSKYRKFIFYEECDKPLGIYDPLKTVHALINVLSILWTAKNGLIHTFRKFKLRSFNILQGKSDSNEDLWTTLVAYCGGRLENGSACGKNPLVLGESKHCECGRLICPACGFCCNKCREKTNVEAALDNI